MGVLKNTPYPSAQRDTRELVSDVFMRINGGVPFWTSFDTIASCRRLEAGCKNIGTLKIGYRHTFHKGCFTGWILITEIFAGAAHPR